MAAMIARSEGLLYSPLASDPEMSPLVDMFIDDLPERVETLLDKLQASDREGLRRIAHQMSGAAGSYGFQELTEHAAVVEALLLERRRDDEVAAAVNALVDACRRARRGMCPDVEPDALTA